MAKIFISTNEPSAEMHAVHLLGELKKLRPDLVCDAAGTAVLAEAGANVLVDMTGAAAMGLTAVIGKVPFFLDAMKGIREAVAANGYDAVVFMDSPSFHLPLAQKIHRRQPDLPIVDYISPKIWAWRKGRYKRLRRDFAKVLCILPFEEKYLRDLGVAATYVGNPTNDRVREVDSAAMAERLGVAGRDPHAEPHKGVLAVFPGSRKNEVRYLWPEMVRAVEILRGKFPDLKPVVSLAPGWRRERLLAYGSAPDGVDFVEKSSLELLAASSIVLAKSGTTTLEAALLGKPMVVTWATGFVNAMAMRIAVMHLPYVSLPNIVAGREVVREMLQFDARGDRLAAELERLLSDPEAYGKMRAELLALRDLFGDEGGTVRAAREIVKFLP